VSGPASQDSEAVLHPPLEPLRARLSRLEAAGIPHALGASGLLAALGLVDRVNDWDVTLECDDAVARALFQGERFEFFGNNGVHADHKLSFEEERIELIPRFAFFCGKYVVRIPTVVTRRWLGVPVGSPVAWYAAYWLLGELENDDRRRDRAARLERFLRLGGADEPARAALLGEPLPDELRRLIESFEVEKLRPGG
jgi:hypothetical protein